MQPYCICICLQTIINALAITDFLLCDGEKQTSIIIKPSSKPNQ